MRVHKITRAVMPLLRACSIRKLGIALALFLFLISNSSVFAQQDPPSISTLSNTPKAIEESELSELGVTRVQVIDLQTRAIDQISDRMEFQGETSVSARFDIFENRSYHAVFTERKSTLQGGYVLSGYLHNSLEGRITLASNEGIISAILTDNTRQFQLSLNEFGLYQFVEIDQSVFPEELDLYPDEQAQLLSEPQPQNDAPMDASNSIDVMVVYTSAARQQQGGVPQMANLISLAVQETNAGYADSGINHRLNLVHTAEVNYSETDFNWENALGQLTNGAIGQVSEWRNTYAADLVVMIVNNSTYCGIGWVMQGLNPNPNLGFSIVSTACATGYYSFGHEIGHNLGAQHDRPNSCNAQGICAAGAFNYSYGYQAPNNAFRTVMAYNCSGGGCPRINRWSNPDRQFGGQPTGVHYQASNSADNVRTLNQTAAIVANFRQSVTTAPATPSIVNIVASTNTITIRWNSVQGAQVYLVEESAGTPNQWVVVANVNQSTTTYTYSGLKPGFTYTLRLSAGNQYGTAVGEPVSIETFTEAIYLPFIKK